MSAVDTGGPADTLADTASGSGSVRGRPVVVYFSRTGTTHRVASDVADRLPSPAVHRIRPRTDRSYPNWLARSFVPGSTVPIDPVPTDLRGAEAVFLGAPKWTLSCPPVNAYLDGAALGGVRTGLFVTCGGFDERRYTRALADRLADRGADLRATLLVRRDAVGTDRYTDGVDEFREVVTRE